MMKIDLQIDCFHGFTIGLLVLVTFLLFFGFVLRLNQRVLILF